MFIFLHFYLLTISESMLNIQIEKSTLYFPKVSCILTDESDPSNHCRIVFSM